MLLGRKKSDPLGERARALSNEIAALEAEIAKLNSQVQPGTTGPGPKFRSSTSPGGNSPAPTPAKPAPPSVPKPAAEPVFEDVRRNTLAAVPAAETPEMFNELGIRKYDLPALFERLRNHFRPPTTSNPRLINYLAAGGVQGLRPLRYEKRVARDRFIVLVVIFVAVLSGLLYLILRSH